MDEFDAIEAEWNDLEENGVENRNPFAVQIEVTAADLEAEFEGLLGY